MSTDERVRQLLEAAAQAQASGRALEAERLLSQAQAEAPRHPKVLHNAARQMLRAGDCTGAHEVLQHVARSDPSNASVWLDLAAALRGLKRPDDEMRALERVLAIVPTSVRGLLQKASLLEIQGKPRAAAATYRQALQTIPPGTELPPAMRSVVQHARQAVEANNRALEGFLEARLKNLRARYADEPLGRFDRCLATLLQKQNVYWPQPSFMHFPHLPALEFHERGDYPWLHAIEAAAADIRAEFLHVLADGPATLQPYVDLAEGVPLNQWAELNRSRRWSVYFLWKNGAAFPEHLARCPRTVAALEEWPRWDVPGCGPNVMFSVLEGSTHIPPHTGVNNTRLIVHLPLIVPPGCMFRVGAERREWHQGKAFVFDDTFEHEARNDSAVPRAVLILDCWNPRVSEAERELVRSTVEGVGEYYGTVRPQQPALDV
jgi:aspartyl/asparaginyl beta-hydroxylase (cupin superfamily)